MILKSKIGYCVTTADCLPILFCSTNGNYFGGIHCGRRGLINGIIENLLEIIKDKGEFMFLFCPSICAEHYEVDESIFLLIIDPQIKGMESMVFVTSRRAYIFLSAGQIESV